MSKLELRGIAPPLLLENVRNTMPFLFDKKEPRTPYTEVLLNFDPRKKLNHYEYFELCLCAHYTSVASYVPTDVDNQIRKHLWTDKAPASELAQMISLVLHSANWNFDPVTKRNQSGLAGSLSGHNGEWFSVAVGAYAFAKQHHPELAQEILKMIGTQIQRHQINLEEALQLKDASRFCQSATIMAHNFGDLDRVIDQWELAPDDLLRCTYYKLGHTPNSKYEGNQSAFLIASRVNKELMASENHRHYPLRKLKCLRQSIDLFLPLGPYFDNWGNSLNSHMNERDVFEVVEALVEGFYRLSSPKIPAYGYARALAGICSSYPKGLKGITINLSTNLGKKLNAKEIVSILQTPQKEFEESWNRKSLLLMQSLIS